MNQVGIRELKSHLAEYIRRVGNGTSVIITDRGRPVATLSPIETPKSAAWAIAMVAEGRATWSGGKPAGLPRRIPARGRPASAMVLEDRR